MCVYYRMLFYYYTKDFKDFKYIQFNKHMTRFCRYMV